MGWDEILRYAQDDMVGVDGVMKEVRRPSSSPAAPPAKAYGKISTLLANQNAVYLRCYHMKSRLTIGWVCVLALLVLAACNQSSGSRGSARIVYVGFLPTGATGPTDTVRLRATPITFTKETPLRIYFRCVDEFGLKQYDAALRPTFTPPTGVQPINFVRSTTLTGTNVLVNDVVINSSVSQASGIYRLTLTCTNANNQTSDVITQDFTLVCPPTAPPGSCQ